MGGSVSTRALGNLPVEITSFVGRRREAAGARSRMTESRLVTLVGAGGVGKTRLALHVAAGARRAFRDGVWMVDLASLGDASRLAQTVLSALAVRDQSARHADDKLADYLRDRQLLIVLDNCEHLLEPCALLIAGLLRSSPGLRILATSREALGIDGEHLLVVPPLSTPDPERPPPPEAMAQYEAVNLLVDRARGVRPDFGVTEANHEAVARLCARLDGVPLAIELAATRLRSLSIAEVVKRLDHRFELLTDGNRAAPQRQQTLRALVDWSYELCTHEEQALWARLSVFPGSFDLAAVEGVCSEDGLRIETMADLVDHLVAKSVVLTEHRDERVRYRMLATVREYGAELMAATERSEQLRRRHRDHYLERARAMAATWCGPEQADALARMRDDHDNLRAALEWSAADPGQARAGAALAAALRYHWVVGGFLSEGRRWLDQALESACEHTFERGEALWVAAWVSMLQGDTDAAERRLDECEALAGELADDDLAAHVAHWRGLVLLFRGDPEGSVALVKQALDGHERSGDANAQLTALFQLAVAQTYVGDLGLARETCEKATVLSAARGERWARAYVLWASGVVAWREGDLPAGKDSAKAALALHRDFQDGILAGVTIELLAWIEAAQSACASSARLLGAARAVWREIGTSISAFGPHLGADSAECERRVVEALGDRRLRPLMDQSTRLRIEDAVAFALEDATEATTADASRSPLTRREDEVAGLVAQGLSNRAIAEMLVISRRTVDGHVERILAKLGFSSRSQVAAWVAEQPFRDAS